MKKENARKEFFKLKMKNHSCNQCRKILKAQFGYEVTIRTLQRWSRRIEKGEWNLLDNSTKPKRIYKRITPEIESKIIDIRNQTGWGAIKIEDFVDLGHTTINKILNKC